MGSPDEFIIAVGSYIRAQNFQICHCPLRDRWTKRDPRNYPLFRKLWIDGRGDLSAARFPTSLAGKSCR
jgi:hypothetical protein